MRIRFLISLSAIALVSGMAPIHASAQLIAGTEVGVSAYKSNELKDGTFLNRDTALIGTTRFYFGAQRNWATKGWIADLTYGTSDSDYVGLTNLGFLVASTGKVRVFGLGLQLHWPVIDLNRGGVAVTPRLGYRSKVRSVLGSSVVGPLNEDFQEGVMAVGLALFREFDRGFSVRAKLELERSLSQRLRAEYPGAYEPATFDPKSLWRPQFEITGAYRINARHSVSVVARAANLSSGSSASIQLQPTTIAPVIQASFPGQRVRINSLNAGYAYHF